MNKNQKLVVKVLMTLFLVVYLGSLYFSDRAKEVPMDRIQSVMETTTITEMQQRDRTDLSRYFSINDRDTKGFLFYKDLSPMSVNEILIVRTNGKDQTTQFLESAQAHLESQKNVFGAYGTDQMALLNEAAVSSKGNYVYYICGPDAADWLETFLSLI